MAGGIAAAAVGAVRRLTAREVKLADLADNTDPDRLATLTESDRARLTEKYGDAYAALGVDFNDGARRRSHAAH